jgi:hypothetical protein
LRLWPLRPRRRRITCRTFRQGIQRGDTRRGTTLRRLATLASLKATLGDLDLDRVSAWFIVNGYAIAEPGYLQTTAVMNPCSELIELPFYVHGPQLARLPSSDRVRIPRGALLHAWTPFDDKRPGHGYVDGDAITLAVVLRSRRFWITPRGCRP